MHTVSGGHPMGPTLVLIDIAEYSSLSSMARVSKLYCIQETPPEGYMIPKALSGPDI